MVTVQIPVVPGTVVTLGVLVVILGGAFTIIVTVQVANFPP
jgi:large-conductance mechanosensitive channel